MLRQVAYQLSTRFGTVSLTLVVYWCVTAMAFGNRMSWRGCATAERSQPMTPIVRGETLTYRQNEQEQELTVGTPAWFAWLATASTFSFVSEEGLFTARHERSRKPRGGRYWKAYRKQHGKLSSHYLGKSEVLTLERLQAVALALAHAPARMPPAREAFEARPPALRRAPRAPGDPLTPLLSTKLHVPRPRA